MDDPTLLQTRHPPLFSVFSMFSREQMEKLDNLWRSEGSRPGNIAVCSQPNTVKHVYPLNILPVGGEEMWSFCSKALKDGQSFSTPNFTGSPSQWKLELPILFTHCICGGVVPLTHKCNSIQLSGVFRHPATILSLYVELCCSSNPWRGFSSPLACCHQHACIRNYPERAGTSHLPFLHCHSKPLPSACISCHSVTGYCEDSLLRLHVLGEITIQQLITFLPLASVLSIVLKQYLGHVWVQMTLSFPTCLLEIKTLKINCMGIHQDQTLREGGRYISWQLIMFHRIFLNIDQGI